ncbi:MAG TPA: response regulator [Bryobacterales bacterium]|nr:response regulator [Bryobacterales bacterium]
MRSQTPTILVVDDDPTDQLLMQEAVKAVSLRCSLRLVSDGSEALDYLFGRGPYSDRSRAPRPDLILLDLRMPRLNGCQVALAVKSNLYLRKIPIVVLATTARQEDLDELYAIGVNSYMPKPGNFEEFAKAMRDLGHYWLERALLPPQRV